MEFAEKSDDLRENPVFLKENTERIRKASSSVVFAVHTLASCYATIGDLRLTSAYLKIRA
jgi:hypothetical protein